MKAPPGPVVLDTHLTAVKCIITEFFLNAEELVVFCDSVGAAQRPCLNLTGPQSRRSGD
jgi:hypothetical protein